MLPLTRPATRDAAAFCIGIAVLALGAGAVRVLPWALDSTVPWSVALPFARSVAMLALEAAVLLGWPLGWALAAHRFVAAGEARVFALLGETPARTVLRLAPSGAAFACALALLSFLGGRDASAPGRVLDELVAQGRASCVADPQHEPHAITIPFLRASWLCAPDREPRLIAPSPIGNLVVNAADARIAEDLRRIDLDDARFSIGSEKNATHVRAGAMQIRGLPPWAQSSKLPPVGRALLIVASAFAASALVVFLLLSDRLRGRAAGLAVAASGPLAALGMLRGLERQSGSSILPFLLLPLAAVAAVLCSTWLAACLPRNGVTAST